MIQFQEAKSPEAFQLAVDLFKEYADQIETDLSFQNFDEEMENIEHQYSKPWGTLYLIYQKEALAGCFAIRKFESTICELKRMYLRTSARGSGLGKTMLLEAIEAAKSMQYQKMRLDTLPTMKPAIELYQKVGFYEIDPYRFNPIPDSKFFEIDLEKIVVEK
ncbi:MAG: GNAT family N-acetyltransferase [Cytophagales bacterium]|nr:GNAT family N-acetyltransferase [Cytophagales bacterium]